MASDTQISTEILPPPPEESRCTTVLEDMLEGYAGIREAHYDLEQSNLQVSYDPRILTPERALHLVRQAGQNAGTRVAQCASKGSAACAACTAQMAAGLRQHYKQASLVEPALATYRGGVIEVSLNGTSAPGNNHQVVETTFPTQPEVVETPKWQRITRRQLEVVFTALTALASLIAFLGSRSGMDAALQSLLFGVAYVLGGVYGLLDGVKAVREDRKLDVNLLMIIAALGAAVIGQPIEGAALLFLFSLSNTLQSFALERNRQAIQKLLDLRPPTATLRRGSRVMTLPVEQVVIGDTVIVKPGERFPIDGEVITGSSDVNQATITGESIPVHKIVGDEIFASTVNGLGGLEVRVTRLSQDTTLARIVQMVEQAQKSKARTQTTLDAFEQVYAWFVLGGAILLASIPVLFLNQPFQSTFYRAMTWLVVASPCALVISTPASILSAIANGARNGILFKGGIHLEKTAAIKVIAFDKTGTLTTGSPTMQFVMPGEGVEEKELIRLVAAAEARSEHPVGNAIVQAARSRGIILPDSSEFRAIPGLGVEATVEGASVWVGNRRLFTERGVHLPDDIIQMVERLQDQGQTVMLAYRSGKWLGLFGVADTLRSDAPVIIQRLRHAGVQRIVMLTGDNEKVAQAIAKSAGVDEVHAGLLPQDKVRVLKTLRQKYGEVAMVGDGVNDAPALAAADIGIAMGGAGSDVALETADLVLMSDDLTNLPHAIHLARRSRKIIWQNLTFALAVIVLLVVSAFGFNLALPLGVVGHEGSTVLVVLNGLRLLVLKKI